MNGCHRSLEMLDHKLCEEGGRINSRRRRFPVPLTIWARIEETQFVDTQPSVQLKEAELGFPS